jgi:hypothetical protein
MARKKKKNLTWVWVVLAIVVVLGTTGYIFRENISLALDGLIQLTIVNEQPDVTLTPSTISPGLWVKISLFPDDICVGDSTTGSITSNIPNGICSIYYDSGAGATLYKNVVLDSSGSWSETNVMSSAGVAIFRVACIDGSRYALSNTDTLTVRVCSSPTTTTTVSSFSGYYCCLPSMQRAPVCRSGGCLPSDFPWGPLVAYPSLSSCQDSCKVTITTTIPATTTTIEAYSDEWCDNWCKYEYDLWSYQHGVRLDDGTSCHDYGLAYCSPLGCTSSHQMNYCCCWDCET